MEPLLLDLKSELKEIKITLKELKAENALLCNEILGLGTSAASGAECSGLLETKTLREIVEQVQFDIKNLKTQDENEKHERKSAKEQQLFNSEAPNSGPVDRNEANHCFGENRLCEHEVVGIEHGTIEEERLGMKSKFLGERVKVTDPADGASLAGKTAESISAQLSSNGRASCVLKLSNHLNSDLINPQQYFDPGTAKSRIITNAIMRHTSEAFACSLKAASSHAAGFLTTLQISSGLRLAVSCWSWPDGQVYFILGFTPQEVPTNLDLQLFLQKMRPVPDVCRNDVWYVNGPLEYFVHRGNLLARGQMSSGPHSVIHVDIIEMGLPRSLYIPSILNNPVDRKNSTGISSRKMRPAIEASSGRGDETRIQVSLESVAIPAMPKRLAGLVQLRNCLNVSLKNPRSFIGDCERHNDLPTVFQPFKLETFHLSSNTVVQAMFSFEIDSTDLGLEVAFIVDGNNNAFSVSFVSLPAVADQSTFNSAIDPKQWKTHLYRKFARAQDGEQEIQMRNIRARVSMSGEAQSCLKIRIFAV